MVHYHLFPSYDVITERGLNEGPPNTYCLMLTAGARDYNYAQSPNKPSRKRWAYFREDTVAQGTT